MPKWIKALVLTVSTVANMAVVIIGELYEHLIFPLSTTVVCLKVPSLLTVIFDQMLGLHNKL